MLSRAFPIGLLALFAALFVMGCADNPAAPSGNGVAAAPGAEGNGISEADAIQIALGQVAGEVLESEREKENGQDLYEVEIKTADGVVKEVQIDPNTGEVVGISIEDEDDDDKFLGIF
jgi:hypothetical protein